MSQPVTTNPFIIMVINMTVVFLVLILLWVLIECIHKIDPTKKKADTPKTQAPAPVPVAPVPLEVEPVMPTGTPQETIAVIAAAVVAMGYSTESIRVIRPLARQAWKGVGTAEALRM